MELEDFKRSETPAGKRSRLELFRAEILDLKAWSYADWQIQKWLKTKGIDVTRQTVQQFIQKTKQRERGKCESDLPAMPTTKLQPKGEDQPSNEEAESQSPAERDRARRERKAARFIRESSNTVLNILQEKKQ